MGAVTFSIDRKLVETLKNQINMNIFVETGTFKGDAVNSIKDLFQQIYSVELSKEYHAASTKRFQTFDHITILHGHSAEKLAELMPKLKNQPVLYWLDAHWCVATNTAGEQSQCPLLHEIRAISEFHPDSVILIDDARLFLATPPAPHEITHWPNLTEIIQALRQLSSTHHLMVINDCIAFYPARIETAMMHHAHQHGIDWLHTLDKGRDYDTLLNELNAKEEVLQAMKKTCDEREALIAAHHIGINPAKTDAHSREILAEFSKLESLKAQIAQQHDSLNESDQKISQIQSKINDVYTKAILDLQNSYETIIKKQSHLIDHYETGFVRKTLSWVKKRFKLFMQPKLGELQLYGPRDMSIPKWYLKANKPGAKPTISIVTPSYNQGIYLDKTIRSLITQNYPALEYIVQDGGSRDKSVEVLKRYDTFIKHWESVKDKGQSNAINLGFQHTSGEIMAYLNSDDILLPGTLHYVGEFFAAHPEIDVIYGHRVLIDQNDQEIGRWILPPHDNDVLSWADYIPQETLFWRRDIWEKAGGKIDESFRFAMDWDLILRFREAGARFARVPRFLGAFRIHQSQKTSSQISQTGVDEMDRLRERCLNRYVNPLEISQAIKKYLNRHLIYHKLYQAGILRY